MLFWIALFITIIYYFVLIRIDKKRKAAYWAEQNAIGKAPIDFPPTTETILVDEIIFKTPSSQKKKSISAQQKQRQQEELAEEIQAEPIQEKNEEIKPSPIEPKRTTKHKVVAEPQATEEKKPSSKQTIVDPNSCIVEGTNFLLERLIETKQQPELKETTRPKIRR